MIGMAVREDDRRHRLVAQLLSGEGHRCGGSLAAGQRIDHDPAGLAFDQRDVGNVEASQLVDAVRHLEQADLRVQQRMAPQAGVDGGGCGALLEIEGVEVGQHRTVGGQDLATGLGNEATLRVLEITLIGVERQVLDELRIGRRRGRTDACASSAGLGVVLVRGTSGQHYNGCSEQMESKDIHQEGLWFVVCIEFRCAARPWLFPRS